MQITRFGQVQNIIDCSIRNSCHRYNPVAYPTSTDLQHQTISPIALSSTTTALDQSKSEEKHPCPPTGEPTMTNTSTESTMEREGATSPEPSSPGQRSIKSTDSSMEAKEAGRSNMGSPPTGRRGSRRESDAVAVASSRELHEVSRNSMLLLA